MPRVRTADPKEPSFLNNRRIDEEIRAIRALATTQHQLDLYVARVHEMRRGSFLKRIRSRGIIQRLAQLRRRLESLPPTDPRTSTDENHHTECKDIIKDEFLKLNDLKLRDSQTIDSDRVKEEEAIAKDRQYLEARTGERESMEVQAAASRTITLYDMQTSRSEPVPNSEDFTHYSEIIAHIIDKYQISVPELWIRREKQHNLTQAGFRWTWVFNSDRIEQGSILMLDFLEVRGRRAYVVALLHENGNDSPVPLEIPRQGEPEPCCPAACKNLGDHLRTMWPNRNVRAYLLDSPADSNEILIRTFNTSWLRMNHNELCLKCTPRA